MGTCFYLGSEYTKRIHVASLSDLWLGQSECLRVHQFRCATTDQLMKDLRPGEWGGFNEGRTHVGYTRSTLRVDRRACLEKCGGERVMCEERTKIPMRDLQAVGVVEMMSDFGNLT